MVITFLLIGVIAGYGTAQIPAFQSKNQQASVLKDAEQQPAVQVGKKQLPITVLTQEQVDKLTDNDPVIGDANAPITLVEFSDYQCPFSERFFSDTLPKIYENYIAAGKVKLVFRNFPLGVSLHPQADMAAEASECANIQVKFKEMHDTLFENQSVWSGNADVGKIFKGYAKEIGLSVAQFNSCYDKKTYEKGIEKDVADGRSFGVNGTPTFFINGKSFSGALPYEEVFKPVFDAELAGKKWQIEYDAAGTLSVKVD